jgi:hypothetical protein
VPDEVAVGVLLGLLELVDVAAGVLLELLELVEAEVAAVLLLLLLLPVVAESAELVEIPLCIRNPPWPTLMSRPPTWLPISR